MGRTTEAEQMRRKHVFCVNGDPVFLDLIRELFQHAEFNVTTTNFVPNTFAQIAALQPDVLIIDLVLGREAGFDLLEHLAAEAITRDIPVIAVSTTYELLDCAQRNVARYGADRYITKPLDVEELLETVLSLTEEQ